jgi:hypothetical protein
MFIAFIYRYFWNSDPRAYYVTHEDGVTVVRVFANDEIGAVVNPVPATRLAEIQAHIDSVIEGLASFPSA